MSGELSSRKAQHLRLTLEGDVGFATLTTGLDDVRVMPRALPERDLEDVDLSVQRWGRRLAAPLLISCMTGGTSQAGAVNAALAVAAQQHRVGLGLGSGRVLLEDSSAAGFAVRDLAPDALVLANLGAVQLHQYRAEDCRRLVELCQADGLVLHLNAVQEAVQPGGDTAYAGLLERIAGVCERLDVPVIVKEVGFGLSPDDVAALASAGVAGVDVAGAGGTNWAAVEGLRDPAAGGVAAAFRDWGLPTADAVAAAREALDGLAAADLVLIGSGGLRHGVDALKVLCLGADIAGIARGFLAAAAEGTDAATAAVGAVCRQLRIAAWAAGAATPADLTSALLQ
ncbi:MAG: type 2 isopentenyl-diphosphate Delta-isomerase [Nitriliruptorales bacterium]|nr:type 2 isopentenyl-diphosphate Delta-isomerase [Nitriliruptorales bacterium]